jgi:transcriptional regulator with XRE-family HTH domain
MRTFTIAAAIKSARQDRGWSQRQLAAASGVVHSTLARIEHGKTSNPGTDTLGKLAAALQVPIDRLAGAQAVPETTPDTLTELSRTLSTKPDLAKKLLNIARGYVRATDKDRRFYERLLDAMAAQSDILPGPLE